MKTLSLALVLALIIAACITSAYAATPRNIIVDTDAGADDLMALAFLLARADISIEAITVVNGLAHVPAGAKNVCRLLELAGRTAIPVYEGREIPLVGTNSFPDFWRLTADELPGINLPITEKKPEGISALAFLRDRLSTRRPVSILALGPLTNLAEVLTASPNSAFAIDDLVIMGGAIRVPGNLSAGGPVYSDNRKAEWNIYVDPVAARKVFQTVTRSRLVPLDASNTVPLDEAFLEAMKKSAHSKLGLFALHLLESNRSLISQRIFFAWDPLAAVALVNPAVLKISSVQIDVLRDGAEEGYTVESATGRQIRAALTADPILFRKLYLEALR